MTDTAPVAAGPIATSTPPDWVYAIFDDIDSKRFGAAFDVLTDDAEMHFGVYTWTGPDAIRTKLREFDGENTTKHHILEYWDGGPVKFFHGHIDVTNPAGKKITSVFNHIFYMSPDQPDRLATMHSSVGPFASL